MATLEGFVGSTIDRERPEEVARWVPGVLAVRNEIVTGSGGAEGDDPEEG